MWADTQIGSSTDLRFRSHADRIIHVLGQEHNYSKRGEITATTWYCLEFDNIEPYERYKKSGVLSECKQTIYTHHGNIFRCVNSFSGKEYFYHGMKGNFHTTIAKPAGNDMHAMDERCKRYPLFKKEQANNIDKEEICLWKN